MNCFSKFDSIWKAVTSK